MSSAHAALLTYNRLKAHCMQTKGTGHKSCTCCAIQISSLFPQTNHYDCHLLAIRVCQVAILIEPLGETGRNRHSTSIELRLLYTALGRCLRETTSASICCHHFARNAPLAYHPSEKTRFPLIFHLVKLLKTENTLKGNRKRAVTDQQGRTEKTNKSDI